MKVFVIVSGAVPYAGSSDPGGQNVFVQIEKVFQTSEQAEAYFKQQPQQNAVVIEGVNCFVQRSIFECEVE